MRRLIRRALIGAGRLLERASRALFFAAAGTLKRDDFKVSAQVLWRDYAAFERERTIGFTPRELELVEKFVTPRDRVLVVGAGTGRDVLAFAQRGCAVCGVEPVPDAVATARTFLAERQVSADMIEGFIEDVELPGLFDVVMLSPYSFIPNRRHRIDVLRKLKDHLAPEGRILLLCMPRWQPSGMIVFTRWMAALTGADWRPEVGDFPIFRESHRMFDFSHLFGRGEMQAEAREAGLRVVFEDDEMPYQDIAFALVPAAPAVQP